MELWPHQKRALSELERLINAGAKRICVAAPTGAGKSVIMRRHIDNWQNKIALYADRRMLLTQLSSGMTKDNMTHGIRAAGHAPELLHDIQLCMAQTEVARCLKSERRSVHNADHVIWDEAHKFANETAEGLRNLHRESNPDYVDIGFTATPLGLGGVYDELIIAGTNSELRRCGALVPAEHFGPDEPDTKWVGKVKVDDGECGIAQKKRMEYATRVFGSVVEHYIEHNPEGKPTILFAPGVRESKWFAQRLCDEGIAAAHIDGEHVWLDGVEEPTSDERRQEIADRLRDGNIKVVTNRFCLDDETEILTLDGWVGRKQITREQKVANWDNGKIYFKEPDDIIIREREPDEAMVSLESPRLSIRVTENHDMLFSKDRKGSFSKTKAINLCGERFHVPVSGFAEPIEFEVDKPKNADNFHRKLIANSYLLRKKGMSHEEARVEAERRLKERYSMRKKHPRELTLDECKLIGFWVGDGNKNRLSSGGTEYRMWEDFSYRNIVSEVDRLLKSCGIDHISKKIEGESGHVTIQWSLPRGTGFGSNKRNGVYHIEDYLEKSGSQLLWGLNNEQFDAFLSGLWMANGRPHYDEIELPSSGIAICSANQDLLDILQAIATCRGYRSSVRRYGENGKDGLINFKKTDRKEIVTYRLQKETETKSEIVWCVSVQSENIVTRRKGSVTICGNCLREAVDWPWVEYGIFATVFGSLTSYIQAGGRVLRASPSTGKTKATIIDHGGNWWRHGSLNSDRQWDLEYTDRIMAAMREQRLRDKSEPEPISCVKCHGLRMSGDTCPYCGFKYEKSIRQVLQADGTLREMRGDIFRKRRELTPSQQLEQEWCSRVKAIKNSKKEHIRNMTFAQLEAAFSRDHNWKYPPKTFRMMPVREIDWYLPISQVKDLT